MAKERTEFVCQNCGARQAKWMGRCPECGQWNTLAETLLEKPSTHARAPWISTTEAQPLSEVSPRGFQRLAVPMEEFSRVLGGGIVPGSVILLGGDPGIGKSTLLLQLSGLLASDGQPVLYASGEESPQQIKLRAERLGIPQENLYVLAETDLAQITEAIEQLHPRLAVVDSIQAVYLDALTSSAGSVSQVRECASVLLRVAKSTQVPVFLVGHVTKTGTIAGPRVLEHIVDAVLQLEGERFHAYRVLRGIKNRFGSTNEVGVFEMRENGLEEIANPSQAFLAERTLSTPGSTIAVTLEGTRPLLVEVQALTSKTSFATPRRTANGIDFNRLLLLTAVLTRRVGLGLSNQDVFVNVVGGLRISEPAVDLSVALGIASSYRNLPVDPDLVAIGEVGLSGELRSVSQMEKRLKEAAKLGFKTCLMATAAWRGPRQVDGIRVIGSRSLSEAVDIALIKPQADR